MSLDIWRGTTVPATISSMKSIAFGIVAASVLLLVGCNKGSKFVGTWNATMEKMPAVVTFNGDKTVTMEIDLPQMQGVHVSAKGTWREQGDKLYITPTDVHGSNLPAQLKGQEASFDQGLKQGMTVGKERENTVKWNGDDSFDATSPNGTITYTRKK
jgi:hypothetical protein